MTITHRERIEAALAGQRPDRQPIALWRHFPVDDQDPYNLAEAHRHFQVTYDFDLLKITPASSFCLKDWGAQDVWEGNPEGTRRYIQHVIQSPKDWEILPVLHPKSPHLARQLECTRLLCKQFQPDTPVIQTIFSPLAQAKNLAGSDLLLTHLRTHPQSVMKGLDTISRSAINFLEAVIQAGVDGIFFAVQHAQSDLLTREEFQLFGKDFDIKILQPAQVLWCNMLHLHGKNVYFDMVEDYPCQIINWHDRETQPSLKQAYERSQKFFCGGLQRETITLRNSNEIEFELADAVNQINGKRLILGTGCVLPVIAPHGNILTARKWVDRHEP